MRQDAVATGSGLAVGQFSGVGPGGAGRDGGGCDGAPARRAGGAVLAGGLFRRGVAAHANGHD